MTSTPDKKASPAENVRLRRIRWAAMAKELSRKTDFTTEEVQELLNMYYTLTDKGKGMMDKQCFVDFMDRFLGVKNTDAVEKMHQLCSVTNKKYLTEREFVSTLSVLLYGSLSDTVKLSFGVYINMLRAPVHTIRENATASTVAKETTSNLRVSADEKECDQNFVGPGRSKEGSRKVRSGDKIALDDYRISVNEKVTWSQFQEHILPKPKNIRSFMRTFTTRPYVNKIKNSAIIRQQPNITARTLLSMSKAVKFNLEMLH